MKIPSLLVPARMLALGTVLITITRCSVSEQVKETPTTKSTSSSKVSPDELKENQAYDQMQFRLNFMDEARLAGQDILFVRQAADFTAPQQAALQTALQAGKLPLRLRMRIFARNPSPLTLKLKQLDYQLLVDGQKLSSGSTGVGAELEASAIVTLPIAVDLNIAAGQLGGSTPAAFAVNLADFTRSTRRLTLRIRPTYVSVAGRISQADDFQPIALVTKKK